MNIYIAQEIREEVKEQLWADQFIKGFNREAILVEWLREEFGMEQDGLYVS